MAKGEFMRPIQKIIVACLLVAGFGVLLFSPLLATPVNAQIYYYTPTASADGNVYYTVREGENCESISALTGTDINSLRQLNNLGLNDCSALQVGQILILASVPTPMVTEGPTPTPMGQFPTPIPPTGYGTICVYLYNDINGNAMAEANETNSTGLAGGEVSIVNKAGDFYKTGTTLGDGKAVCFEDAPEGEYTISIAIPDGYNPTSNQNYTVQLKAGDTATVNFSAQASSSLPVTGPEKNPSVFLAIIGGLVVLVGIGLGVYAKVILKK
jgi:hypothetical protein